MATRRPKTIGYLTELRFAQFDGEVVDRGDCFVVASPANPSATWGNFLLFDRAPTLADFDPASASSWHRRWERELGMRPGLEKCVLAWDCADGALGDAVSVAASGGWEVDEAIVLAGSKLARPPHPHGAMRIRRNESERDWSESRRVMLAAHGKRDEDEGHADGRHDFVDKQFARYRAMQAAGLGAWFGGWIGDAMVGTLGMFVSDGIGRYQLVATDPAHQRQGVCATLVHGVGAIALHEMGAKTLVIIGSAAYHAVRVYESVGLRRIERLSALIRSAR